MNQENNENIKNSEPDDVNNFRLNNTRQVKRFMQKIINEYNNNQISTDKAKTISTLINSYIKILELLSSEKQKETANGIILTDEQIKELARDVLSN